MSELLTSAQMRAIEQAAISAGRTTGLDLMERAGQEVVTALCTRWPDRASNDQRAVVLCGPGNNGGDGLVIARLLRQRGWLVAIFMFGDPTRLPPDAAVNFARLDGVMEVSDLEDAGDADFADAPVVIDALFGTGLQRPVPQVVESVLSMARACPIVAVDMLSGLQSDTGEIMGSDAYPDVDADLTVTFERPKLGHYIGHGPRRSGHLCTVSIGLQEELAALAASGALVELIEAASLPLDRLLNKPAEGHKYSHGHALVLAGGVGRGGAARLAARGALRIGAGLVTVGCAPAALIENAARLDAIMLRSVADADALEKVLADPRVNALCLGPGLGHDRARALVPVALGAGRATVLDADALAAFAETPDDLFAHLHGRCVLTPHMGEFARVFPDLARRSESDAGFTLIDAARAAALRTGAVVLLKGACTVIAAPDGTTALNAAHYGREAPWLATAGAGDVLAGMISGLLARGFAPLDAARIAAFLHVEAARAFGPGLVAEDLPEMLPVVLRGLADQRG